MRCVNKHALVHSEATNQGGIGFVGLEPLESRTLMNAALVHTWTAGSVSVCAYDTRNVPFDWADIHVKFGKNDSVASISIGGLDSMYGLGIAVVGASSVGSIKDTRKGDYIGDIAFIASDSASIGPISLQSGLLGYALNGAELDGISFANVADLDADGNVDDLTAVYTPGKLGSLSVSPHWYEDSDSNDGYVAGDIIAGDVGTVSINTYLMGEIQAVGSIGNIKVVGGDIYGSIVARNGNIGNIVVTGVAAFEPDEYDPRLGQGSIDGGNISCAQIHANVVNGKSIGNITLTGGSIAGDTELVDIASVDSNGDPANGSIGKIVTKSLKYTQQVIGEEVYDKWGEPKVDRNGDEIIRAVRFVAKQGGGIWANIDTLGTLGGLTTAGGDIEGDIHAGGGIGAVSLQTVIVNNRGTSEGQDYDIDTMTAGSLTARLRAEPGETAFGIKSISVVGGDIYGDVIVTGKIGNVKIHGIESRDDGEFSMQGGGLLCEVFEASDVGNITLIGGDFAAHMAADSIGNISVVGGNVTGSLTAANSIGNISFGVVAIDAWGEVDRWGDPDEGTWYEFIPHDHVILGGSTSPVSIALGGSGDTLNPAATLGKITGYGVEVTVNGTVPWDPAQVRMTCKEIRYVASVTGKEKTRTKRFSDGEGGYDVEEVVVGYKVTKEYATLPGEDAVENYLHNALVQAI